MVTLHVYATTVTGLGPLLERQARALGLKPVLAGNDGRGDVVALDGLDAATAAGLRTAENILLRVAELSIRTTARQTAGQLRPEAVAAALAAARRQFATPGHAVRVVVRVRHERHFTRRALLQELSRRLRGIVTADDGPSVLELWAVEATPNSIWVGLRLPTLGRRAGARRVIELPGSLPPAVAAAMIGLVGHAAVILDPCCGAGTIPIEAAAAGLVVVAGDIDGDAVSAARANTATPILRLDARRLPFPADSVLAVVANLPFGRQYKVQGRPVAWYRRALSEFMRVAPTAVVLAAPTRPFRQALGRLPVELRRRNDLEIRGNRTAIWVLQRRN